MVYNFDEVIDRFGTGSSKWDKLEQLFGSKEVLPVWVADMDFRVPEQVVNALRERVDHGIFGYTNNTEPYFNAVINWMKRRHDWQIKKEWICHSPGIVTALNLIVSGFTEPGEHVLIQTPVYHPFKHAIENHDRVCVTNSLKVEDGKYKMDLEDLEEKFKKYDVKCMILCSPHNPVGRVWTKDELLALADLCLKYDVLVVADEIHADLVFEGSKHICFASLSDEIKNKTIVCTAPSKTFNIAGLQHSNIIIPNPQLRSQFKKEANKFELSQPNSFGPTATEVAYNQGEEWLDACIDYIYENYKYAKDYFEKNIPELSMSELEGTYLAWVDCRKLGLNRKELEQFMIREAKVGFNQGAMFGGEGEGFVRFNLACPRQIVKEALTRLEQAIKAKCRNLV
ncbi:putative C-S lyase [Terrilactibacillus sp. BCM23-1]|uniref:cysteine-S-conjugate beta-lyase n=1 Tax=Terrilactibacillus tamarindi TaxID=2599694 RepID=A0A6N8CWL9_9BACI|nr:MalY/PatB family protein [Terrilactibacillus tamarindi]MTT33086.1 putative C-S lyase [Terrilactibacillus tamarindi]